MIQKSLLEINPFLDKIFVPQISNDQLIKCSNKITELELTNALKTLVLKKRILKVLKKTFFE